MTLFHFRSALLALFVAAFMLTGCPGPDDEGPPPDAGADAGTDAGSDAGDDAGDDGGDDDGGGDDGGDDDDGDGGGDGGEEEPDPDVVTGGAASSEQLQAVRDVTDENAEHAPALSVEKVAVTYIRPAVGSDPAGFFVQAEATGPALFIAVDPATIATGFSVGDIVSFEVTRSTVSYGQHRVTAIDGLTVVDSGFDVATLVQDLSDATDLITGLDGYESELIQVSAHMAGDVYECGDPSQCNAISTEGIPEPQSGLRFRMSPEVVEAHGLRTGCDVAIGPSPMWRRSATAQVSAFVPGDVTAESCILEPKSAIPVSPTVLYIEFNAPFDQGQLLPEMFTITGPSGPLAVSGLGTDRATVALVTAQQEPGASYVVAIAETVADRHGWTVPPGTTVGFTGFLTPAKVRINEVELNAVSVCDVVELRVIEGGLMSGFELWDRNNTRPVFTFPDGFIVQKNELILIHQGRTNDACNGGVVPEADETGGPDTVDHPMNVPGAYDFWGANTGISMDGGNALRIHHEINTLQDFVALGLTGTPNGNVVLRTNEAVVYGHWAGKANGEPYITGDVYESTVPYSSNGADGTAQRTNDGDSNDKNGWEQLPSTLGTLNPGQSPLP